MYLMSLLAALLTLLQTLFISFAFVILFAQLLRQELCLLRERGGPGCLHGKNKTGSLYCIKGTQNKDLVLRLWRHASEPAQVLDKPSYSASLTAICLFPLPRFLQQWQSCSPGLQVVLCVVVVL